MKSRSLVLLSGEGTTVPEAEARALFLAYDPGSKFERPEARVLLAGSRADPFAIGGRVAFARRVGVQVQSPSEALPLLEGRRVRFRCFDLRPGLPPSDPGGYLNGLEASIDLDDPEFELTLVRGEREYLAVTAPMEMEQGWSGRRPRSRPFFHPSAIFPKLSRALFNMSRCREGQVFLEPFAGTGSIALEASISKARVVAIDVSGKMTRGSLSNMQHFAQAWMGVVRADSAFLPLEGVDAVATDLPYGRASSTRGRIPADMMALLTHSLAGAMKRDARAVVMHPQWVHVDGDGEFAVEEEHDLHVHKLLTRTISVLRRR